MKQVLIIHGGNSYSSYDTYIKNLREEPIDYERLKLQKKWKPWIAEQLPNYDVLLPNFPNGHNAVYDEWKIYFEKLIPFFGNDIQLVGHSLGAMFLAKYLQENPLKKTVRRIVMIAGPYDNGETSDFSSFNLTSVKNVSKSSDDIHLFQSEDDPLVPFREFEKYRANLPMATIHVFKNRGHFTDDTFPELLELLKQK